MSIPPIEGYFSMIPHPLGISVSGEAWFKWLDRNPEIPSSSPLLAGHVSVYAVVNS